tara:strand:- start:12 stop:230 length:219 start_codon:yes stop_codon:yes gene_type:complete
MTINKTKLKKIIKEEVQNYLSEYYEDEVRWEVPDELEPVDDEDEDPWDGDMGDWDDNVHPDDRPRLTRNSWD